LVVYISPSGGTARVARTIQDTCEALGTPVLAHELGRRSDPDRIFGQLDAGKAPICLYLGTPVYAGHAVPPIMEFIARLPAAAAGYGVPFVTWGNVSSGIALAEMGSALTNKGYPILGAAKIVAKHSLMWALQTPLGNGHPNGGDDRAVASLVKAVDAKLKSGRPAVLPPSDLTYQPERLATQMAARTFEVAKAHFPKREVATERCTQCGLCADQCPTAAITLSPLPEFGASCIYCFNCVRLCPEAAIAAEMAPIHEFIRNRAEQLRERPLTKIFV
jgi:ferredoxin